MIINPVLSGALPSAHASVTLTIREALSGISGTISLVSWIVLLVPQILENYKNQSGDGVSTAFLLVWLFGDIANLAGALKSDLLSTVITLAIYFCLADIIIISQTFYYKYTNARKIAVKEARRQSRSSNVDDPTQPLFSRRRSSGANSRNRLSRTMPGNPALSTVAEKDASAMEEMTRNFFSIISVVFIGCLGWFLVWKSGAWSVTVEDGDSIEISLIGAILGYISSVLYLGARIPQIIKNYRCQSCEGLSILFFMLSLLGNLSYGAGILLHSTEHDYVIHNLPWLIGSLGTMVQDFIIFGQFHYYKGKKLDGSAVV
ncbi:PQ-loop-domain-containing protein [Morchella conica CCBAS932]|uniref:PQ-loop-domain-containing protein n=1 Tax=Morchella conica CCBAS932 TaxID=1392247 RepID=A0A3N4K954_9PEZI|nr:PQ-loop-domain-containing protein [Morchella conica CCBAS932]